LPLQIIENKYFARNPFGMNILQTLTHRSLNKIKDIRPKYPRRGRGEGADKEDE
jgi:hypothetical protein